MRRSLILFIAAVLAFVCALVWFAMSAPEQVPGHINASGEVDRWDSRAGFLTSIGIGGFVLIGLFAGLTVLISRLPGRWLNLPKKSRAYWTSPEHRPELNRIMSTSMDVIGAAVAVLFTGIIVTSGLEARDGGASEWVFLVPFVGMLVTVFGSVIYLFIRTRLPRGQQSEMPRGRGGQRGASRGRGA